MLEKPEEGRGAEPLGLGPICASSSLWECASCPSGDLQPLDPGACAGRAGLQGPSIRQIGVLLASREQSSRFIPILGVCLF